MRFSLFAFMVVLLLAVTLAQARVSCGGGERQRKETDWNWAVGPHAASWVATAHSHRPRPSRSHAATHTPIPTTTQSLTGKKGAIDGEAGEAVMVRATRGGGGETPWHKRRGRGSRARALQAGRPLSHLSSLISLSLSLIPPFLPPFILPSLPQKVKKVKAAKVRGQRRRAVWLGK